MVVDSPTQLKYCFLERMLLLPIRGERSLCSLSTDTVDLEVFSIEPFHRQDSSLIPSYQPSVAENADDAPFVAVSHERLLFLLIFRDLLLLFDRIRLHSAVNNIFLGATRKSWFFSWRAPIPSQSNRLVEGQKLKQLKIAAIMGLLSDFLCLAIALERWRSHCPSGNRQPTFSRCSRLMLHRFSKAIFSGALPVRIRQASSPKVISKTQCSWFSIDQCCRIALPKC